MSRAPVLFLTGPPAVGKTTIARALRPHFERAEILDGDELRGKLGPLGFAPEDREWQHRRAGWIAERLARNGITPLVSLIGPTRNCRDVFCQEIEGPVLFVHLWAALEVREMRDPKGLYAKWRRGEIRDLTGADALYEPPINPLTIVNTGLVPIPSCVSHILGCVNEWSAP